MKYLDAFRDGDAARRLADEIAAVARSKWTLMEVCGGQTHAIVRFGIDQLLPEGITLLHGPGCPVCVTPMAFIDGAIDLAARPEVTLCSFGDMLRVPGSQGDLLTARAAGGDVRPVYSPLDAVKLAMADPERQVVFFAVGFETTAPAVAQAAKVALARGVENFSLLVAHVLVPPAMEAILAAEDNRVQGFLAAGHVCTVMGMDAYLPLAARYGAPIVVTGFEPLDILRGVLACVQALEAGEATVINCYERAVKPGGNDAARALLREVFEVSDRQWRGLGELPASGLRLGGPYGELDAARRFGLSDKGPDEAGLCRSGEVLRGVLSPPDCPEFGRVCTPERPLGAPMVSSEGACAAYYRYRPAPAGV